MQNKLEAYTQVEEQIKIDNFDIKLGDILGFNDKTIGIRSTDVFGHIVIFGATGSGKTNTSVLLARELQKKGFDVVILDWYGEYHNYLH